MKLIYSNARAAWSFFFLRFAVYALLALCLFSFSGCIRLTGTAGYTKVKDDEVVTKSTGFDLDSARLMPGQQPQ